MVGFLEVTAGPDKGRSFSLAEGKTFLLGRAPNTDTRLHDPAVSRVHCVLHCAAGKVALTDSGSTAGTLVNGKRVTEHELVPGDRIEIGGSVLTFREDEPEPGYTTIGLTLPGEEPSEAGGAER